MSKSRLVSASIMILVLLVAAVPAFAQSTTTIDISASSITPNLFLGANIILLAL